jgi:hypothetical protein
VQPGERVEIKKRIAATLGGQPGLDIDLILSEFGFPTVETWRGSAEDYVIAMIRGASDNDLRELDSYLHPSAVLPAPPQPEVFNNPNSPWNGTGLRLFISHCHEYADKAGALRDELAKRSIDAFVAHTSINPTEEWEQVILAGLRTCDACAGLLTPEFPASRWCDQEIGFCLARNRVIVPLEWGAVPYGFIGRYQSLRATGRPVADVALSIFELLVRKSQSRDAMARALVQRWVSATSYDGARENYAFLRKIPPEAWTQQDVNEVWEARERVQDLREANIDWQTSEQALEKLFEDLPFERPSSGVDDDIPF